MSSLAKGWSSRGQGWSYGHPKQVHGEKVQLGYSHMQINKLDGRLNSII
jgi:hypothetical protein